jgi:hypothetical protein
MLCLLVTHQTVPKVFYVFAFWQSAWAGPLFLQARHPQLMDYQGEAALQFPENFKDLEDDEKV